MRVSCTVGFLLFSCFTCLAQDDSRILDEADDERIVDEAEDLELIAEFVDLEEKVAVDWNPRLAERAAELDTGLLVPLRIDDAGQLLAIWPLLQTCTREIAYSVAVPKNEIVTRVVEKTRMQTETRSRMIPITKYRPETKTRTVQVSKVNAAGETVTEEVTQDYTVQVPYTEQIEQTYTVQVPVKYEEEIAVAVAKPVFESRTRTESYTCFSPVMIQLEPQGLTLFRGDRRRANWQELQAALAAEEELYVAVFQTADDWLAVWDNIFSPDAFVIILDQMTVAPVQLEGDEGLWERGMIHPLPLLARRSDEPEHQYVFSPYVKVNSDRPNDLVQQPALPSQWLTGSGRQDLEPKREWIYEIEFEDGLWSLVDGRSVTQLEVEHRLAAGDYFIAAAPTPPRSAWEDVFRERTPVYLSAQAEALKGPTRDDIRGQVQLLFAAKQALKLGDGATVANLITQIQIPDLLDANMLCQAAYLLHRQGMEEMAFALVGRALQMTPSPLDRERLIKSQGVSRVWLEEAVLELPLRDPTARRNNDARQERMKEISERMHRARELTPEASALIPPPSPPKARALPPAPVVDPSA